MSDKSCKCGHPSSKHGRHLTIEMGKRYPCSGCDCADYDQHFDPFPAQCPECDAPWVKLGEWSETCVGYYSPPGHDHNGNCLDRAVTCGNGHKHHASLRRSCPACDWKGKETCWCDEFKKVDAWPVLPETKP